MNKKLLLLPLSMIFIFMMAGMASATIDCNASIPSYITKGTELNATFNTTSTWSNVSVKFEARGTLNVPNSSFSVIDNIILNTSNRFHTNLTFGSNIVLADGTYDFRVTCTANSTSTESTAVSATVTGKDVDRGVPGCNFASGLVSNAEYAPNQKWTVQCINATSATIKFGSNSALSMTEASDSCTFTGTKGSVPEGSYSKLTATISDGLNSTTCSLSSITIDIGIPLKQIAALAASGQIGKAGTAGTAGTDNNNLVLIVIFGLAAYWWVRNRKK